MRIEFPAPYLGEETALKLCLRAIPLYRDLQGPQFEHLAASSLLLRPARGARCVTQGEAPKGVYTVVHGQVKLHFLRKDGAEKTLNIIGPNDCFGLAETMLNQPHLAFATPVSNAMVVLTPRETLFELARENFSFAQALMTCAAHQSQQYLREFERKVYESATQRLAEYLLEQCERQCTELVRLNVSKTLMASRLGIAAPTLSRLLSWFSSEKLIEVQGRQIQILDRRKITSLLPTPTF